MTIIKSWLSAVQAMSRFLLSRYPCNRSAPTQAAALHLENINMGTFDIFSIALERVGIRSDVIAG